MISISDVGTDQRSQKPSGTDDSSATTGGGVAGLVVISFIKIWTWFLSNSLGSNNEDVLQVFFNLTLHAILKANLP